MPATFQNISLELGVSLSFFFNSISFESILVYSLCHFSLRLGLSFETDSTCFFQSQALSLWMLSPVAFYLFGIFWDSNCVCRARTAEILHSLPEILCTLLAFPKDSSFSWHIAVKSTKYFVLSFVYKCRFLACLWWYTLRRSSVWCAPEIQYQARWGRRVSLESACATQHTPS